MSIENNLSLEGGRVTLGTKKRAADLVWNRFLPTLSVNGSLNGVNEPSKTTMGPITIEGPTWSVAAGLQIQWQGLNIALVDGVKQIREDYRTGNITFQKARIQLERDIRKQYLQILLAEENLKVQKQNLDLAEQRVAMTGANYAAGLSSELVLFQARVTRDNLIPSVDQIRNSIKILMASLAMNIGLPYDTEFELDSVPMDGADLPLDVRALISKAAEGKPDIMELRSTILSTKTLSRAQKLQTFTPSLSISWGLSPTFTRDAFKDSWSESDYWMDRGALTLALSWNIGAMLPFTTQGAALRDMDDTLRTLNINLAQLIRGTEVEVYNTVFTIQQARESLVAQQRTVDLAQRTYSLTLQAFQSGLQDLLELQNVQQQLSQAQVGVLQQKLNFLTGIIDLEYSLGVPFGTLMKN
jgi:outer membrane protein TolC